MTGKTLWTATGAVAFTLVAVLATTYACSVQARPSNQLGTQTVDAVPTDPAIRELLRDAWTSDGHYGFFLEGPWGADRSPFSLYETYWNIRLAQFEPTRTARLVPQRVAGWLAAARRGGLVASLPTIVQIHHAVHASVQLGLAVDGREVAAALESLRSGGRYRATREATQPHWGSTALALETLQRIGVDPPREVVDAVRRQVQLGGEAWPTATTVEEVVPLLRGAASLARGAIPVPLLAQRVQQAVRSLGTEPDVLWLGGYAQMLMLGAQFGVSVPPLPSTACERLTRADGTVGIPGVRTPDAQVTYNARVAGCTRVKLQAAPYSRAGWPAVDAGDKALAATAIAVPLASSLGVLDAKIATQVRNMMFDRWLPADDRSRVVVGMERLVSAFRLRSLAAAVAPLDRQRLDQTLGVPATGASDDDLVALLYMANVHHLADPAVRVTATGAFVAGRGARGTKVSMFFAVADELAARVLGAGNLHQEAVAAVGKLRLANGLYALQPTPGTASIGAQSTGSMTATVLAAWVNGERIQVSTWERYALCRAGYCADHANGFDPTTGTPLGVLGLTRVCTQRGCGSPPPMIL